MSIHDAAFKHLLKVERDTVAGLAFICRCSMSDVLRTLGDCGDFVRVAGAGCWDFALDRTARVMALNNRATADREVHRAAKEWSRALQTAQALKNRRSSRPAPTSATAELPTIVHALRAIGRPSTVKEIAEHEGFSCLASAYNAIYRHRDLVVSHGGRPIRYALRADLK